MSYAVHLCIRLFVKLHLTFSCYFALFFTICSVSQTFLEKGKESLKNNYPYLTVHFSQLLGLGQLFISAFLTNVNGRHSDLRSHLCVGWQTLQFRAYLTSHNLSTNNGLKLHHSLQCSQSFPCLFQYHSRACVRSYISINSIKLNSSE